MDCTSYYELEQQEYARKGVLLSPDLWMMKLMVGAVDRSYDEQVIKLPWPLCNLMCLFLFVDRRHAATVCADAVSASNSSGKVH